MTSLVGREDERARLTALLDRAREDRSGVLLLQGPAGIGKTALLRWAMSEAEEFCVLRARGMESESDIPFAGLAELVTPLLSRVDEIPRVQAEALRGAVALGPPALPRAARSSPLRSSDRFTVPAALLSLLAAEDRPVLAVIDDAQWLDQPSLEAFLFAGRRLEQEGVAVLVCAREDARLDVPWLERLAIAPLADEDARSLLGEAIAPGVADRLVETAAGNPLALLEIPGLLSAAQLAGREPLEDPLRPGTGNERAFSAAVEALPEETRRALLIAAAAGSRRLDVIGAAIDLRTLEPAEAARIVSLADGELEFRHPLLRSTVYHGASLPERREAHAVLAAAASDGAARAWHLAACAVAPDEEIAAALEAAALDARGRGGARHRGARSGAGGAAHSGRFAARPAPAVGGRRCSPLRRDGARRGAAGGGGGADLRSTAGSRCRAPPRARRDAPRLAHRRARAARPRGRARALPRSPPGGGDVARGGGRASHHRRPRRADRRRGARTGAGGERRAGRRAARHRGDRRGRDRARPDRRGGTRGCRPASRI